MNGDINIHDSGERETGETGAQTDPSHSIAAMELLSPYSLWSLSEWLGKGASKYAPRNWEKGIPFSICIGKFMRHFQKYLMGDTDEDHLAAVGFWWHALAHYEKMIKLGLLPAELNDIPKYEQQIDDKSAEYNIYENLDCGWYIGKNLTLYLHKDLKFHSGTGYTDSGSPSYGEAPGYYPTKEIAEAYLRAYLVKENKS